MVYNQLQESALFFGKVAFASASVDLWTAQHAGMGYAALDMQFGNPDFGISEVTLAVGALPGTHDASSIKAWVEESIKAFNDIEGIEHKYQFTPTTLIKLAVIDGGANIMLAFKLLHLAILYCMAHKLHLCVKRALGLYGKPPVNSAAKRLSEKHRKLVTHFSKSPKNTNLLLSMQQQSFGTAKKAVKPVQDVVTRWTSTAGSWLRTLILRTFFLSFFAKHDPSGKFESALTPSEYNELRANLAVIDPARGVTEFMQASRHPTLSLSWPRTMAVALWAKNVRRQPTLDDPKKMEPVVHDTLPDSAKETGKILADEIEKRFAPTNMPIEQAIAMAVDPRTKGHVAGLPLQMQQKIYTQLSNEVKALRETLGLAEAAAPTTLDAATEDSDALLDELMMPPVAPGGAYLQLTVTASADVPEWQQDLDAEVLLYFQQPGLSGAAKDFNPSQWWKEQRDSAKEPYVILPVIATLYLSLACTAARNERTFSYTHQPTPHHTSPSLPIPPHPILPRPNPSHPAPHCPAPPFLTPGTLGASLMLYARTSHQTSLVTCSSSNATCTYSTTQ